jgi:hypothetical protein
MGMIAVNPAHAATLSVGAQTRREPSSRCSPTWPTISAHAPRCDCGLTAQEQRTTDAKDAPEVAARSTSSAWGSDFTLCSRELTGTQ